MKKLVILIVLVISTSNLVKKVDYNTKINEIEKKIADHYHDKYITTQEFIKLTSENFAATLAQANLTSKNYVADFVKKTDFDGKRKNLNKKVTLNKTKHVLVENELNKLSKKLNYYQQKIAIFSKVECILQAMMDLKICLFINQHLIHLKKTKALIMFLVGNQRRYTLLNLHHYVRLSWIAQNFLDIEQE